MPALILGLTTLNQILSAAIVMTAASLLFYALTFNLRDRVARVFAGLLALVTIIYFCDAMISTLQESFILSFWLRLQWLGILFIPVAFLHFSDALLATTGQPSRGRRRLIVRLLYLCAFVFLGLVLFTDSVVYGLAREEVPHLLPGPLFWVYVVFWIGNLGGATWNFVRAYRRSQTPTTRRRMLYLIVSATTPAVGAFPFLLLSANSIGFHPLLYWVISVCANIAVTVLVITMAYAVSHFGVATPDRIIKSRLLQWLLRGPFVASVVLTVYLIVTRFGPQVTGYDPRVVPIIVIGTLLLLQSIINFTRLPLESALFYGADRQDLRRLQILSERLLTSSDLRQFLESVLVAVCDEIHVGSAFIAGLDAQAQVDFAVSVGPDTPLHTDKELPLFVAQQARLTAEPENSNGHARSKTTTPEVFEWGDYWVVPLSSGANEPLGLLGVHMPATHHTPTQDESDALQALATRAAVALEDCRLQREVFQTLDRLLPQIEVIQRLRATSGYGSKQSIAENLTAPTIPPPASVLEDPDLAQLVKQALSHYWGGPKLAESPLMQLHIVERAMQNNNGNPVNALRAVLAEAIERIKPEGQRKFTTEWVLYNILEMKFLQNRRVREVAMRLAVSEADLYRKQRLAIEQVSRAIAVMEKEAAEKAPGATTATTADPIAPAEARVLPPI